MLIGVKTNPHYDFAAPGDSARSVIAGMLIVRSPPSAPGLSPRWRPRCRKLYIAPGWPMEHLMRLARNCQARDPRVLDISMLCGFFCSERRETGISVVVTTDREPNLARDIADRTQAGLLGQARHAFHTDMVWSRTRCSEAIATEEGPVVLGDLADSGGAGTPGDGTAMLAELLEQKRSGAVVGISPTQRR